MYRTGVFLLCDENRPAARLSFPVRENTLFKEINMKKRILSAILAFLMLASAVLMSACSNSGQESKETTPTATNDPGVNAGEEVNIDELSDLEQRALIPDDLPDKKFGGEEFRVVTNDGDQYEQEIIAEELNGDSCNDAVYNRNVRIEDRFDVKIMCERNIAPAGLPKTLANAGTMDYHIVGLYDYQSYTKNRGTTSWPTTTRRSTASSTPSAPTLPPRP